MWASHSWPGCWWHALLLWHLAVQGGYCFTSGSKHSRKERNLWFLSYSVFGGNLEFLFSKTKTSDGIWYLYTYCNWLISLSTYLKHVPYQKFNFKISDDHNSHMIMNLQQMLFFHHRLSYLLKFLYLDFYTSNIHSVQDLISIFIVLFTIFFNVMVINSANINLHIILVPVVESTIIYIFLHHLDSSTIFISQQLFLWFFLLFWTIFHPLLFPNWVFYHLSFILSFPPIINIQLMKFLYMLLQVIILFTIHFLYHLTLLYLSVFLLDFYGIFHKAVN